MTWFLVALGAPLLFASANYIDKYVLSRFVEEDRGVGGIVIFSSLFAAAMIPISYLIAPETLGMANISKIVLILNGLVSMISLIFYLKALQHHEASAVVPLYQLIPVFSYILGYLVLGEVLTTAQMIACMLIVLGALALSLVLENGRFYFNWKLLGLMSVASFFTSLTGVIFKKVALGVGYWPSQFWEYCGIVLVGLLLLIFIQSYRRDFIALFRVTKGKILSYSSVSEAAMIGGDLMFNFSILLAPVALVYVVNSFQPLFALILGVILSILLPRHYSEDYGTKKLVQKTVSIFIMIAGGVLLAIYG